jgi:hypothetical protein
MQVTYPTEVPQGMDNVSSSEINNTYSVDFSVLYSNDTIVFQFAGSSSTNVHVNVSLIDDQNNGPIQDAAGQVDLAGMETKYIQFSGFPARADGSVMNSCTRHFEVINSDNKDEGCSCYQTTWT